MNKTIFKIDKRSGNYTIIDNRIFLDENMSWKAKGILSYLLSRPQDWEVVFKDLVKRSSDGESSVSTGLEELRNTDYVERKVKRNKDGTFDKWVYYVFEDPNDNTFSKTKRNSKQKEKGELKRTDPDLENREVDLKDSSPDCKNPKVDTEDSKPVDGKPEVDNPQMEKPVVEDRVYTNTDNTKTDLTNTNKNKKTSSLEQKIEEVKSYWFKIFKTEVGDNFDHQIKSLLKDFKLKELKAAIYNRSRASYYIEQKPEYREDPECFFNHPKTVGRDMNRTSWRNGKDKNKVYEKNSNYLRQFDGIRKEHERSFRKRDNLLNPPPDPRFVKEMKKRFT